MKGMELSKLYFEQIYLEAISNKFPELIKRMAFGLVGEGSECFGYDDEISRDHDFGPSCCIWLNSSDFKNYRNELNQFISALPKEFMGFQALNMSEWGEARRGVLNIEDFYYKFLGKSSAPETLNEWRVIPETALSTVTNGEVFLDNLGDFSHIRDILKNYYPEDIRLNKIATRCMKIAQSGQYNFSRCFKRNELVASHLALSEFIDEAMHLTYLLNKKYRLFYKWIHRDLKTLPILGKEISEELNELITSRYKFQIIEKICSLLINEMKNQNLTNIDSDFLADHGPIVQSKIKDIQLKNWSPWLD